MTGALPADYTEKKYAVQIHIGGEGLVYANDGAPYEMISAKMAPTDSLSAEEGKNTVCLSDAIVKNGRIDFYMDAGFNGAIFLAPFGVGVFRYARLAEVDEAYYAFYYDYLTVLSLYASLPKGDGADILAALNKAYDTAMSGDPAAAGAFLLGWRRGLFALILGLALSVIVMPVVRKIRHEDSRKAFPLVPFLAAGIMTAALI